MNASTYAASCVVDRVFSFATKPAPACNAMFNNSNVDKPSGHYTFAPQLHCIINISIKWAINSYKKSDLIVPGYGFVVSFHRAGNNHSLSMVSNA